MQQHLHKFLILHRSLPVSQLGSFVVKEEPARIDQESKLLFAPRPVVHFEKGDEQVPSSVLFRFLAEEMGTDETAAQKEYDHFCEQFRTVLERDEISVLPGVGRLVKRHENDFVFTPESNLIELLPPMSWTVEKETGNTSSRTPEKKQKKIPGENVPAVEKISAADHHPEHETDPSTNTHGEEVARDRWWIYAILLLAAGILALLFHYQ